MECASTCEFVLFRLTHRDAHLEKQVEKKGDLLLFGDDFASPCSVETNYKARTTNTPYTIEALWFLLQRPTVDHGLRASLDSLVISLPAVRLLMVCTLVQRSVFARSKEAQHPSCGSC